MLGVDFFVGWVSGGPKKFDLQSIIHEKLRHKPWSLLGCSSSYSLWLVLSIVQLSFIETAPYFIYHCITHACSHTHHQLHSNIDCHVWPRGLLGLSHYMYKCVIYVQGQGPCLTSTEAQSSVIDGHYTTLRVTGDLEINSSPWQASGCNWDEPKPNDFKFKFAYRLP